MDKEFARELAQYGTKPSTTTQEYAQAYYQVRDLVLEALPVTIDEQQESD